MAPALALGVSRYAPSLAVGALTAALMLLAAPGWGAWGTGGASCANQSETSASTDLFCSITTEALEAGNVAVVTCASDNVSTSDGNTDDHGNVTGDGGNTWIKAYEFTEAGTGAGNGATISVHYSKISTTLALGHFIVCNFNTAVLDRSVHLTKEFTIGAGNLVSVVGTPQGEASGGGDAGTLTISGLTSGEYLFIRGIATESNNATSMTATASYSLPGAPSDGCNNTTGGGEATDMGACSEYRIMGSSTGDTSNPTLSDTGNDNASVYVALQEAAPAASTHQVIISQAQDPAR